MRGIWTGIGLVGAALLCAQLFLFGPVDIWSRNAGDLIVSGPFLAAAGLLTAFVAFVPLAIAGFLLPARWRPAPASALAAVAVIAWAYSSVLFRESLAIDGRDELLNLAAPLGAAELPLLALAALALAFLVWRIPRQSFVFLLVLLLGNGALTITHVITVRAAVPELAGDSADPLWRFSRNGNVLAILLDGLQSDVAAEELRKDAALAAEFDGFTFFKNTTGIAPTTFPTMPAIHSGRIWDPNRSLIEQYEEGIRKNSFLAGLARSGYETTMVGVIRSVCPQGVTLCSGPGIALGNLDVCPQSALLCRTARKFVAWRAVAYFPQIALLFDMSLMRVAPYALKSVIYNSGNWLISGATAPAYSVEDTARSRDMLDALAAKLTVDDGPRTAKFLHVSATHQPYIFDADCKRRLPTIASGVEDAARCSLLSVGAILKRLKALNVYDSATILVFADHGIGRPSRYRTDGRKVSEAWSVMTARANPLLLAKPAAARGTLSESMAEASVADIAATVCELTKSCTALDGRSLFDASRRSTTKTKRTFFYYDWRNEYWTLKVVPGVTTFTISGPPWERASWRTLRGAPYELGKTIDFRIDGNLETYAGYGWGEQESWGTWSDGNAATLLLSPTSTNKADLLLTVRAHAFVAPQLPRQEVDILVNDRHAGTWTLDSFEMAERTLRLPAGLVQDFEAIEIAFVTKTARSPAALGLSSDTRQLGIGIAQASLRIAPELASDRAAPPAAQAVPQAAAYRIGDTIDFRANANAAPYMARGWAEREGWGTWTDGDMAILRLAPVPGVKGDLILRVRAFGLLAAQLPRQEVEVRLNGQAVGSWTYDSSGMTDRELRLPADLLADVLEIAFVPKDPRSPAELGLSPDARRLGMAVAEVSLRIPAP